MATGLASGDIGTISLNPASVAFVILGNPPSLKNSRPIRRNRKTGKPFSARSDEAARYIADFRLQVPRSAKIGMGSKESPVRAIVTAYYRSWRSDLDLAIVYDCLQHSGVVSNDRWIRCHVEYAEVDPKNPRVEIMLEEM